MTSDEQWMRLAIAEARKGIGTTSPNPPVGAVIVKNNRLLGTGWHRRAGEPHAEPRAIADATATHGADALAGAAIYVTLEPCSTTGRTPACTSAIIGSGITTVVYGSTDPNPAHAGRADRILASQGIHVRRIPDPSACDTLILPFAKVQRTGLPWVILKSAMSLDGRITRPPGEGQWLSSPQSRTVVQSLRHECDAVLTSGRTLRMDDPALTIRDPALPPRPQPWRMVVTRGTRSSLPPAAQVFTDAHADRTLVQENGNLLGALETLAARGCNSVLVEAGGTLTGAMLDAGLADEVAVFITPMLTGGPDQAFAPATTDIPLSHPTWRKIGDDILLRALVLNPGIR